MTRRFAQWIGILAPAVVMLGCGRPDQTTARPLFKSLSPRETGITFENTIPTSDSINILTNVYLYNGGGVGIGDVDNDGLADIFLTGNMVSSRLYLNKGNMRFEDITQSAGVTTHGWASGVSLVDINNDRYLDIYLSMSGPPWAKPEETRNLLFINNGNRTFTEAAAQYGVDDSGFTAHAAFFDYDGDRDLDLFLLGNSPQDFARSQLELHPAGIRRQSSAGEDRLYRNNGNGSFTDVSRAAGILAEAQFGLGVVVNDFNRDGWPDLYLSNDDVADDVLYINNRNGTFSDKSHTWLKHTSFAGMGVDAADFNNDGWPDIMQTDMMPDDLPSRKRMSGGVSRSDQLERRRRGFMEAYTQNTLQLSNGVTSTGDLVFSEIARMAGVAYTHWSWAALFGDCDNDGDKDLLVTSGYPKAVTDFDYQSRMFKLRREEADLQNISPQRVRIVQELPSYRVSNFIFRNNGDLTFTKTTRAWGLDQPGFSYGAAFADLDNNGTLDLVVNSIDAPASVYENVGPAGNAWHYLDVELHGDVPNTRGIGATLMLVAGGQHQYIYHTPYHGYISSMDQRAHFGLGAAARVDSLVITWPDGRLQTFTDLAVDTVVTAKQADATRASPTREGSRSPSVPAVQPLAPAQAPRYAQPDLGFVDFSVQPLLPEQVSKLGPALAVGDVNGDGLDDVFVGGVRGAPGKLFIQRPHGGFTDASRAQPWTTGADRAYEDWGAAFLDANGDGQPDLYVASGSYHVAPNSAFLQDRLYINRGDGRFQRDTTALPSMLAATAAIATGDFDADGKTDLFVGGRLTPRNYPSPPRSFILRNDGGRFTDVTEQMAPELITPGGMVTAAVWTDFDGDGRLDLITAGDWAPLQFFRNEGNRFRNVTESMGIGPTRGRWFSLAAGDFNRDGHPDLVAGNLGLNLYPAVPGNHFGLVAGDFTGVRRTDLIFTQEIAGTEYPWFGLARLGPSVYTIGVRFSNHASFSQASIGDVLGPSQLAGSLHYQADTFASLYLQNSGKGTFTATPLPPAAQIAPLRGIVATDVDGDENLDLLVAGSLNDTEPNTPPADAGNGLWLRGDGRGHWTPVSPRESGFLAPGNVTGLRAVKTPTGIAVLVASPGDSLSAFAVRRR